MAQDEVARTKAGNAADKSAQGKQKRPAPTEEQLIHGLEEWEQGAAYRYGRHAANVGGCYSTAAICLAHDTLNNQRLTDVSCATVWRKASLASASSVPPTQTATAFART